MAAAREGVVSLLRTIGSATCRCPAHSQAYSLGGYGGVATTHSVLSNIKKCSTESSPSKEYAFEMACSNIRYGIGVTQEIGMDFQNLKAKNVCVVTDEKLSSLPPVKAAIESLERHHVKYSLFEDVRVEPTDSSFKLAIDFATKGNFDAFLAVGGGSVIDTAKVCNLYSCKPEAEFLDYVNAPVGKGLPVTHELKPLIAVPTTAGTGSETTGVAIFDYEPLRAKTGIGSRALRPLLGIVDPLHTQHMPERVTANSGFDVLCHALESYTAIPFNERTPRPSNPIERPAYQGSNPISDIWSLDSLKIIKKYMKRAVNDPEDLEARSQMHLASVFAGVGFGNAGVHLCHGMSYPIAGLVKNYRAKDYDVGHPIIPHGLSVVMTSPAVFQFTAPMCPERHIEAAGILGADTTNVKEEDAGRVLSDVLRSFMYDLGVDDGLAELGFTTEDIPALVKGTLPQHRVTKLAPRPQSEEDLASMFESSMKIY